MFILRELLISIVATRRIFFMVEKATVGMTVKYSLMGWGMGGDIQAHTPKLILLSTFAQTLGQVPPLFLAPELAAWWEAILSTARTGPKDAFTGLLLPLAL